MSEGPIITGTLRIKDETGTGIKSAETGISGLSGVASVAGGIIAAEFSRNVVGALEDVGRSSVEQAAAFELATARIIAATGLTGEEAERFFALADELVACHSPVLAVLGLAVTPEGEFLGKAH